MEYAVYPFLYMRITQRHDEGNHLPHWNPFKDYADKPFDEALKDSGRDYFVPQNDYRVVEILGLGTSTTNSVRLETVNKVKIPYQDDSVILEITLSHMEEEDLKKLKVGQIIHKNEKIIREGKDGATANHFHITANIGKYYGLKKNSNGKYVFAYDKSLLPNEAFYIDTRINNIIDNKQYDFLEVPSEFLPSKGYYGIGDSDDNVSKICSWFSDKVNGNYYGEYVDACVKVFQKSHDLNITGNVDIETLNEMIKDGFKE